MKKIVFLLVILFAIILSINAEEKHLVNLSLVYPVSFNKSTDAFVNCNLSLFHSHVGEVRGADFSVVGSVINNDMTGIRASAVYSYTGGNTIGITYSAFWNHNMKDYTGLQTCGLGANYVEQKFTGVQIGSIANYTGSQFRGYQQAGIWNLVEGNITGVQVAGTGSLVDGNTIGAQFGGIANITNGHIVGAQIGGVVNVAKDNVRGAQIGGVINMAGGTVNGTQIGLVNLCNKMAGMPIGLINISGNGGISSLTWLSNIMGITSGFKFRSGRFYSIVGFGGANIKEKVNDALSIEYHYGFQQNMGNYYVNFDGGFIIIDNTELFEMSSKDQRGIIFRLGGGLKVSEHLTVFGGGGMSNIYYKNHKFADGEYEPVAFGGVEFAF